MSVEYKISNTHQQWNGSRLFFYCTFAYKFAALGGAKKLKCC